MQKTFKDLIKYCAEGHYVTVTFKEGIADLECYPEAGMRAHLISGLISRDDLAAVLFHYEPFEVHNKPLEATNFFDKHGAAVLTAREAGLYTPTEEIYFNLDDEVSNFFNVENNATTALFAEFVAQRSDQTYTCWLEAQLLAARGSQSSAQLEPPQ
jgi:hypothetical protein